MKKNFLITTGGSGGHVIPATIFYEHLSGIANLIISTDKRGVKFLEKKKFNIKIIDTPKLNNIFTLPYNSIKVLYLILKCLYLLKDKKINKVFSTGGYMSLPIILAAKILGIKIYLIEPNQVLGRANKFFLNSCTKIFCYTGDLKNFPDKFRYKIVVISPLVSKKIYNIDLPIQKRDKFCILIVGGSQGAKFFDNSLKESILKLSKKKQIKVIHQTSKENISYLNDFYSVNKVENQIFSFEPNFSNFLSQADLCITRAGASTLAELSVLKIPFLAIPLPKSKDNHQLENANFYKNNGCCWIIDQSNFDTKIDEFLVKIIENKNEYIKKKKNLEKLNFQNTWANVNQKILGILNEN